MAQKWGGESPTGQISTTTKKGQIKGRVEVGPHQGLGVKRLHRSSGFLKVAFNVVHRVQPGMVLGGERLGQTQRSQPPPSH